MTDRKLKTPFADLLPPLSTEEREALDSDIKRHGVRDSVVIDEDDNILDGHNRYSIDPSAPVRVISGLSDDEKRAFVIRANMTRRNLSPTQKTELRRKMQAIAKQLRESDPKKWTQKDVADVLGVGQQTVADWFRTITGAGNSSTIDARVKLTPAAKKKAVDRVLAGETQAQVAADFGVTQKCVSNHVAQAEAIHSRDDDKARKTAHLKDLKFEVRPGDFREVLADVDGVSLVLTDPPYVKDALALWSDLAKWASGALAEDGLLVAYSGQFYLPQVLDAVSKHLEYFWCAAVFHAGRGNLTPLGFPVRKVINQWKPLVMFYKPGGDGFPTFRDVVDGAGPEKTHHNWAQPEKEAAQIVEQFTSRGDLVVDPFAGSGGFCKAASDLGRRAIGAEVLAW